MSNKYSSYVVPTEQPRWPSGIRGGAGADGGIGGEHRPEPGSASPDPASPQASLPPVGARSSSGAVGPYVKLRVSRLGQLPW